jgi:hypothetical protein
MTAIIARSFQRSAHDAPIQYALLDSDQFHATRTYDFSPGGLSYEIHQPLEPGTDVCILMENYSPGLTGPEGYRSYVTSICWTRLLLKNGTERYAAGARLVTRSHDIITAENQLPHHLCELCGASKPLNMIEQTKSGAQMCGNCLKHFRSIPSARIRHCVERFMLGNVI